MAKGTKNVTHEAETAAHAVEEPVVNTESQDIGRDEKIDTRRMIPKDIDPHMIVTVRNGFQGKLVYVSRKTGERFVWESFGDEQDMEIGELRNARNSSKAFFVNNWFMFDEPWIVDYIGMTQYYKFAVSIDNFDSIFDMPADELGKYVAQLPDGLKRSVAYRARIKIRDGSIDSNKKISALEQSLGTSLVERE